MGYQRRLVSGREGAHLLGPAAGLHGGGGACVERSNTRWIFMLRNSLSPDHFIWY